MHIRSLTHAVLLLLLAAGVPVLAIINPRFTPTDLVRGASHVWVLTMALPDGDGADAELVETLKGAPPAENRLRFEADPESDITIGDLVAAFGPNKSAPAVVVLTQGDDGGLSGAIEVQALWFALVERDGKWLVRRDDADLLSVWAGNARTLVQAARYVLADPGARFPVRASISWEADAELDTLAGKASGCVAADLGTPVGRCVLVLCEAGDRAYAVGRDGARPIAVTARLGLATRSKRAAVLDANADGRLDLVSWDGGKVNLALRQADGTFSAPVACAPLADCRSLDAIPGPALIAGTPTGPVVLAPVGPGMKVVPLPGAARARDLGAGGLCAAADLNGDGLVDVLQCFAKGMLLFAGTRTGFAPATLIDVALPDDPTAAVPGDFDTDGRLDVLVAGQGGMTLLCQTAPGTWESVTYLTGELAYHGNANAPTIIGGNLCDINSDGRQGVALFYRDRPCMQFFNRGFACFGLARELSLTADVGIGGPGEAPQKPLKGTVALQGGQQAGAMLDLNGDGTEDLLAVDTGGTVWALFSAGWTGKALRLTVGPAPTAAGPLTVTVADARRVAGMYVIRPGQPAVINREVAGPVTLSWADADGTPRKQTMPVTGVREVALP